MAYLTPSDMIGGNQGSYFRFTGDSIRATLKKIYVWAGDKEVKAISVWLTDGQSQTFGKFSGKIYAFQFEDGEKMSSLSLWGNGEGTRLGAIKFKTTHSREFFPQMTSWPLQTEFPMDVGSGICMGVEGRSGDAIDAFGFFFINTIMSTVLTNVNYPTLQKVIPQIAIEEIKSLTYINNSTITQSYSIKTSKTLKTQSSWSVSSKLETTFSLGVKAGIPEIAEVSTGFSLTLGVTSSYGSDNSEEKTETFSFPIVVPPRTTVAFDATIGRATVDLPYTGTMEITCYNGSVLSYNTTGTYKGITYTDAKIIVKDKN